MRAIFLFLLFSTVVFGQTIETYFCYTPKVGVPSESCYKMTIHQKDSAIFFSDTASLTTKLSLGNGPSEYYKKGKIYLSGIEKNGKYVGVYKKYDTNGTIIALIKGRKTVYVDSTGKPYKTERNTIIDWEEVHYQLFNDYQAGIQPPTLFDWSIPTGFTVSGFNVSCDIPMPQYAFETRTKLVFAPEVGVRGCGLRLGLSPFNNDYWDFIRNDTLISFTLLTINASMTYIWKGHTYELIDPVLSNRWYVGADLDFSYLLGHIRLGAFKLVGPEPNRDWNFMISLGLSPAIPVFLYALFTIAE